MNEYFFISQVFPVYDASHSGKDPPELSLGYKKIIKGLVDIINQPFWMF